HNYRLTNRPKYSCHRKTVCRYHSQLESHDHKCVSTSSLSCAKVPKISLPNLRLKVQERDRFYKLK
ncbi:MAG: hypothetical protein PUP92_33660, partial [Rhizonema sp. PD38]|nr:hypothetical protein [Rhizonema sp. PD38]